MANMVNDKYGKCCKYRKITKRKKNSKPYFSGITTVAIWYNYLKLVSLSLCMCVCALIYFLTRLEFYSC